MNIRSFFLMFIVLLAGCNKLVVKIYNGDLTIQSQSELDAFGEQGYTIFAGNLTIQYGINPNDSITNLDMLSSIIAIDSLAIWNNTYLSNLDGLKNLKTLNGLSVCLNKNLENIDGLQNIASLKNTYIAANNSLLNLGGLKNIDTVSERLFISQNQKINTIVFNNLSHVKNLIIMGNNNLQGMEFNRLESVGGLTLVGNNNLTNLDGLSSLQNIDNYINISYNYELNDFCGIRTLIVNNGLGNDYLVNYNLFNPTIEDIKAGNCSL